MAEDEVLRFIFPGRPDDIRRIRIYGGHIEPGQLQSRAVLILGLVSSADQWPWPSFRFSTWITCLPLQWIGSFDVLTPNIAELALYGNPRRRRTLTLVCSANLDTS